jgi:hypothetical protein
MWQLEVCPNSSPAKLSFQANKRTLKRTFCILLPELFPNFFPNRLGLVWFEKVKVQVRFGSLIFKNAHL